MKKLLINATGFAGLCMVSAGLYLQYGEALALIVAGCCLMAGALYQGRS